MALCKTIATLAEQIELQLNGIQENHSNMITVMKEMPLYLEKGDLSAWEADYRSAIGETEDESSKAYKAIDLVYELAAINIFGLFQVSETEQLYKKVVSELKKLGLNVSENMNVSQW